MGKSLVRRNSSEFFTSLKVLRHLNRDPFSPKERNGFNDVSTRKLFANHPEAAIQKYDFGKLHNVYPLLMLCCFAPSKETVQQVYLRNPAAIKEVDSNFGWTPLFAALKWSGTPTDTIIFLAQTYPKAISVPTNDGWTPLHIACAKEADIAIVKLLIDLAPSALRVTNKLDWTPLHLAVGYDAPLNVVKLLLDRYPQALEAKNNLGQTPLDQAQNKPRVLGLLKRSLSSSSVGSMPANTVPLSRHHFSSEAERSDISGIPVGLFA